MDRRRFIKGVSTISVAGAGATGLWKHLPVSDANNPGPYLKISLNAYSFNAPLRSGEMNLEELLEFCAEQNFAAIDPTGYYFPGYPEVPDDSFLSRFKRKAFVLGLDISGTGVRNDFTIPDSEKRKIEIEHVKSWIGVASKMGAPVIRVFTGHGVPDGYSESEVMDWVAEALKECADWGAQHGVMVGIQNHADLIKRSDQVLDLLKRVNSEWVGVILDIGSFRTKDPYKDITVVAPYAVSWQIKENLEIDGKEVKTDIKRIIQVIRNAGYRGYIPIETLGEGDPREKVPRFLGEVRTALA